MLGLPVLLLVLAVLLLYLPAVQDRVRSGLVGWASERTGTTIELHRLHLRFPLGLRLHGLFVADQQGDTLLHAGEVSVQVGARALLGRRIQLDPVVLRDVRAHVHQGPDSVFNFDFIIAAFTADDAPADPEPADEAVWELAIGRVQLERIHHTLVLEPGGMAIDARLDELALRFDRFALDPMAFHMDHVRLAGPRVMLRTTSSPPEPGTYPDLENPLADIDLRFGSIAVESAAFTMATVDTGDSLWLAVDEMRLHTRSMDLTRQQLALDELRVFGLDLGLVTMSEAVLDTNRATPPWLDQHDGFRFWTQDMDLAIAQLTVDDARIAFHNGGPAPTTALTDPDHLVLSGIVLQCRDAVVNAQHIGLVVERSQVRAGPDDLLVAFSARLDATPARWAIHDATLSALANTVAFDMEAIPGDLSTAYRAPMQVPLRLDLRSTLRLDQLAAMLASPHSPPMPGAAADEQIAIDLHLVGTASTLDSLRMRAAGDQGTQLRLTATVRAWDQWPHTDFRLALDEFIMGGAVRQIAQDLMPGSVLPQRLTAQVEAHGEAGTIRSIMAVQSDLGDLRSKAMVREWKGNVPDALDLDLQATHVQLAPFIGDTAIGPISVHITAVGDHLSSSRRRGTLAVVPQQLTFNGHDLSSLRLQATAHEDSLLLRLSADADPLAMVMTAHGAWSTADSITMQMDMAVRRLRLQDLGLMDHRLDVQGHWYGGALFDHSGAGAFHVTGTEVGLSNGQRSFTFAEFDLAGLLRSDSTALALESDALTVHYHSNFGLDSLVSRTQEKLASFFRPDDPFQAVAGRHMALEVTLPRTEWLAGLVLPDLERIDLKEFRGSYDGDADQLMLRLDLPELTYAGVDVRGLRVAADAVGDRLDARLDLAWAERDSMYVEGLALQANSTDKGLRMRLTTAHDEQEAYRLAAVLGRADEALVLRLDQDLLLDNQPWSAHPDNALHLGTNGWHAEHLELVNDGQEVTVHTVAGRNHIVFNAFDITQLTHLVHTYDTVPLVTGVLDGTIQLPAGEQGLLAAEVTLDALHVRGVEIGRLELNAAERERDHITADLRLAHVRNRLDASADIRTGGSTPTIAADAEIAFEDLRFLEPFVKQHLYAVQGGLDGELRYSQRAGQTRMNGELRFDQAAVGVVMTGATYRLQDERIVLDDAGIHFNNVTLLDSAGHPFRLDGRVIDPTADVPRLDLRLRTDRFQLVGSTRDQNALFYGDLFARMDMQIKGLMTEPVVSGELGILEGTAFSIVLPGSRVELIEHDGIIEFVDGAPTDPPAHPTDTELLRDSIAARLPGVALDLRIVLDEEARFAVVLDPTTGDQATFRGSADLRLNYASDGDLTLEGPFTVAEGGYTLEFYGLVKKRFDLVPGGRVVWDGDPLAGRMDIQARYRSETAPYPLVANAGGGVSESERNRLQARLPFEVIIRVQGAVNAPDIGFALDLDRLSRNSFPLVSTRLDQLMQPANEEELHRQVFGLLVLNSFIQDEEAGGAPSSSLATTAARNSVNALLTEQLNRVTGRVVKGMDIQLGVNTYDQTAGGETYQRTALDYKVSQRILNDRITIEAGGSVGVDERDQGVSNVSNNRGAQYSVTYDLTEDGRLRLRAFHENAFDLYDGEIVHNGVAIMLTRDFEENTRDRERKREEARQRKKATKDPGE